MYGSRFLDNNSSIDFKKIYSFESGVSSFRALELLDFLHVDPENKVQVVLASSHKWLISIFLKTTKVVHEGP